MRLHAQLLRAYDLQKFAIHRTICVDAHSSSMHAVAELKGGGSRDRPVGPTQQPARLGTKQNIEVTA